MHVLCINQCVGVLNVCQINVVDKQAQSYLLLQNVANFGDSILALSFHFAFPPKRTKIFRFLVLTMSLCKWCRFWEFESTCFGSYSMFRCATLTILWKIHFFQFSHNSVTHTHTQYVYVDTLPGHNGHNHNNYKN